MIKICMIVLTLVAPERPTFVNFNEILVMTEGPQTVFGTEGNKIYFSEGSALGQSSISVKETVAQVLDKAEECNSRAAYRIVR